jgi:hypothetical protein
MPKLSPTRTPRTPFNLINELPTELLNISLNKVDANNVIRVLLAAKTLNVPEKKRNAHTVYLHNMKISNRFIDILTTLLSNTDIKTVSLYGKISFEKEFDFSRLHRSELFANVKTLEIGNVRINNVINVLIASCSHNPDTFKIDNLTFDSIIDAEAFIDNLRRFKNLNLELSNIDIDDTGFLNKIKKLRMSTPDTIKTLKIDGATTAVFSFSRRDLPKSSSSSSSR